MAYTLLNWIDRMPKHLQSIKATYPMTPIGITVHNTANKAPARNEINYMFSNSNYTSYHVAVDDKEVIEAIPFNRNAWHAGDGAGKGNRQTIGIEICHSTGDPGKFQQAEENAALYIAHVLKQYGWTLKNVYKHQDWSGKYCPHKTLDKGWDRFKAIIQANLDQINGGGANTQAPSDHPIISEPTVTIQQMQDWAKSKGATETFVGLAPIFYDVAHVKGVGPAGVYAQSAKETGYGKFGGVLDETYKNPCGLKTKEGGGDYDPNAHQRFESWEQGITAQVDHLLLYAGHPQEPTPDPRHFAWIAGKAKTWEDLGGNWAPSASYGDEIVRMMKDIANTPKREAKPDEPNVPEWALDDYKKAVELGITTGERPNDTATRLEVALMIVRALQG